MKRRHRTPWTPESRAAASVKAKKWWTPERRTAAAAKSKARWEALSESVRAARLARSRAAGRVRAAAATAAFAAQYPWRGPLYQELRARIARGELIPEPCDRCAGEGRMVLRYDDEARTVELLGWRCYPCRRRRPGLERGGITVQATASGVPSIAGRRGR